MASNLGWTWEEHKKFQNALAIYGIDETPGMWSYLVRVTGKTEQEVKAHYKKIMVGVVQIEAGLISLPRDDEVSDGQNNNRQNDEQR